MTLTAHGLKLIQRYLWLFVSCPQSGHSYYRTSFKSRESLCAICRKTSKLKNGNLWLKTGNCSVLFCFIRIWSKELNSLLSILASRDFSNVRQFSPFPAKWEHRSAWRWPKNFIWNDKTWTTWTSDYKKGGYNQMNPGNLQRTSWPIIVYFDVKLCRSISVITSWLTFYWSLFKSLINGGCAFRRA